MSFYSLIELSKIGLKQYGNNVKISRFTNIYNPSNIIIGNNVRIDDFCILSAGNKPFVLEDNIHIAGGVYMYGSGGIIIKSFSGISPGTKLFSVSDTYDGTCLTNPVIEKSFRKEIESPILLDKHVIIGPNSVILPGVTLNEGVAIGANSLVTTNCEEWNIYGGSPLRLLKKRSTKILDLEKEWDYYTAYLKLCELN